MRGIKWLIAWAAAVMICTVNGQQTGQAILPQTPSKTSVQQAEPLPEIMLKALQEPAGSSGTPSKTRTLRLVQDDAQDYMVSKIYHLKYAQSNDVTPFLLGIVKRYNMNSSVGDISYGTNESQILTVTCPIKMMPYVDDFVRKIDRNVKIDGKTPGDTIKGTGITRAVYQPKYRSGQNMLNVLVNSIIGEGPYGSLYAWDANSNQIYWKDNSSNTDYTFQFLSWIDRPAPQITFSFRLYEVRESELRDLGIEYVAWKNGPGLNMFQAAFSAFNLSSTGSSALQGLAGPVGGFFCAPQFDASFIRILAQSGKADLKNTACLTVSNSDSAVYEIYFNPELQNIVKNNNDQTSVIVGAVGTDTGYNQVYLQISAPIVNMHYGTGEAGYSKEEAFSVTPYRPGDYAKIPGTLFFGYNVQTANAVERNNLGTELIETSNITGNALVELGHETVLARWDKEQEVEQTIGIPWLSNIPILKYLFGTTTTSVEKTHVCLTLTASILNTAILPDGFEPGKIVP